MSGSWVLESSHGAKVDKTSIRKSIIALMSLGIVFLTNVGGFVVPKWSQIGINIGSTIDVNLKSAKQFLLSHSNVVD